MIESKQRRARVSVIALSIMGLGLGMLANRANAQATVSQYFTTAVSNGGTYSWDSPLWSVTGGSSSGPFTSTWQGSSTAPITNVFARFSGGASGTSYTVTVGNAEQMVGMYETVSGVTLTINASGVNGSLDIIPNNATVPTGGSGATLQGFIIAGSASSLIINAPIIGTGGIDQQSAGALSLYGVNTYSGGTQTTGGQVLYYNNDSSFGTGNIYISGTSGQALVSNAASPLTISNNVIVGTVGSITNLEGGSGSGGVAGTNWSGTWALPSSGTTTLETGLSTSVNEISGVISGASAVTVKNPGTLIFGAANTYTGATTVSAGTLKFGAANSIADTTSLVLAGGTLNPGGYNQTMSSSTLGLTAASTIDFSAGASTLLFANSSSLTWSGTLNLVGWNSAVDALGFGTSASGLTSAQLADIEFNGTGLGTATLGANGLLVGGSSAAPEPAMLLPLMGGLFYLIRRRRAVRS